jgi:AcrR family transcriptional regulator
MLDGLGGPRNDRQLTEVEEAILEAVVRQAFDELNMIIVAGEFNLLDDADRFIGYIRELALPLIEPLCSERGIEPSDALRHRAIDEVEIAAALMTVARHPGWRDGFSELLNHDLVVSAFVGDLFGQMIARIPLKESEEPEATEEGGANAQTT